MATDPVRPFQSRQMPARARWATIHIETDAHRYIGRIFVPETRKRMSDVLCDDRPFLCLTDVTVDGSLVAEPFVALNKRYVRVVRVIEEGTDAYRG